MSLFLTKEGKRKSPRILSYFFGALLFAVIFGLAYAVLTVPLQALPIQNQAVLTAVQIILIAFAGTLCCCLLFLLRDKRIVPYSFVGLAVLVVMFYIAALALDSTARVNMIYLVSLYGLGPTMIGNLVSWSIYHRLSRCKRASTW